MSEFQSSAPHLVDVSTRTDLLNWGRQPNSIEDEFKAESHSSGRLIHKGPDNQPEVGLWVCTPGRWHLSIPRDELCYFVAGRATYAHLNGEVIEVMASTLVMFTAGWQGECTVHETIRNSYILL
ncbi:cupin domain-containing protein [Solimicrobium silvestre]|uniref:Putative enzyme of the cupin superfamily n=1 Tax=Solimicrobium silvestre TaxID=2099400 RepID=A0A2S9GT89_9BURK|nr:cupin domain-containing protein [Solimicrobium silvestre]PRC90934.1 putative enzyme of the cupin superfamily [Solimicrobium silvestre]